MKLIAEYTDNNLEVLTEAKKDGGKKYSIEGVFMSAEQKNRNGRIYPKNVMEGAVTKYTDEQVSKGRAVGELNHPEGPTVNLDKVSHKIESLKWSGNNVVGKATVLDTPMGQIVQGLLEGGVQLGVSTRGMGSLQRNNNAMVVKDDFATKREAYYVSKNWGDAKFMSQRKVKRERCDQKTSPSGEILTEAPSDF